MSILKSPLVTEKVSSLNEKGKYGFIVEITANKVEIKNAVEKMYGVNVEKVNIPAGCISSSTAVSITC